MSRQGQRVLRFVILAALALTLACQPARLALPPDLDPQARPMAVVRGGAEGWEQTLGFGPYQADPSPTGPARPGEWAFLGLRSFQPQRRFAFRLKAPDSGTWDCRCALGQVTSAQDLNLTDKWRQTVSVERSSRIILACIFNSLGWGATWRMSLATSTEGWALSGLLSDGMRTSLLVRGSQRLAGPALPYRESAAGYVFQQDGRNLGAVQMVGQQAVWLPLGRLGAPLAAAAGALLLQPDLAPGP